MSQREEITKEVAEQLLSYNPETGVFIWKVTSGRAVAGRAAGHTCKRGYVHIWIKGKLYRAHRLAFLIMTGKWPTYGVDHMNGIKDDNRWENLRDVPDAINIQNKHRPKSGRKYDSLPLGVSLCGKSKIRPYMAKLQVEGRSIYLGLFETPSLAHEAYLAAKRLHHEGCTI